MLCTCSVVYIAKSADMSIYGHADLLVWSCLVVANRLTNEIQAMYKHPPKS